MRSGGRAGTATWKRRTESPIAADFSMWSEMDRDPTDAEIALVSREASRHLGQTGWEPELPKPE
jgi:hypothetical protein